MSNLLELKDNYLIKFERLSAQKGMVEADLASTIQSVTLLETKIFDLECVSELFQFLMEKVMSNIQERFTNLVTYGLNSIFEGSGLTFVITASQKRGVPFIEFSLEKDGVQAPLLDSYGGGVVSIVSLLLRMLTILKLDLRRVLFLDESLAHVSEEFIPKTAELISTLCAKLDFNVLLVTHQDQFLELSDHSYKIVNEGNKSSFKRVR